MACSQSEGLRLIVVEPHRTGGAEFSILTFVAFDQAVLEGQGVFRACQKLKDEADTRFGH